MQQLNLPEQSKLKNGPKDISRRPKVILKSLILWALVVRPIGPQGAIARILVAHKLAWHEFMQPSAQAMAPPVKVAIEFQFGAVLSKT